jgi:hypothetical protein
LTFVAQVLSRNKEGAEKNVSLLEFVKDFEADCPKEWGVKAIERGSFLSMITSISADNKQEFEKVLQSTLEHHRRIEPGSQFKSEEEGLLN